MQFVKLLSAICLAAAVCSTNALADDIYVNNASGDDKFNGKPLTDSSANAGPVRTIKRALELAVRGDRIFIQKTAEPYRESLTIQGVKHSGTDYQPFRIVSDGAILDGTSSINPRSWEHYSGNIFRFMPELKSHQQLYLNGKPADRVIPQANNYVPDLEAEQWALVDGWVYFCSDQQKLPTEYDLRYCKHQTGITLYEVHDVSIEGLTIQGFQLDGVNAHEAVENAAIRHCKIRGNGRSGLSVGGASRVTIATTLLGANGAAQVRSEGYCILDIKDCRLLESPNTGPAMDQQGGRIKVDGRDFQAALTGR